MKTLTLLLLVSLALTAGAQTIKRDSTSKAPCKCYLAKDPNPPANPYAFANSIKKQKSVGKTKKKTQ